MKIRSKLIIIVMLMIVSLVSIERKADKLPHVLVIGIDGLGAHGVEMAQTLHLDQIIKDGAYSLDARTVMPSVSAPAQSSMI